MPLNPQIPLAGVPIQPPVDPVRLLHSVMAARDDMAQMQEAQRQRQEADQIRQIYQRIGIAPERRGELIGEIAKVSPVVAEQIRKQDEAEQIAKERTQAYTTTAQAAAARATHDALLKYARPAAFILKGMNNPDAYGTGKMMLGVLAQAAAKEGLDAAPKLMATLPDVWSQDAYQSALKVAETLENFAASTQADGRPVPVHTVDAQGNSVIRFTTPTEGMTFPEQPQRTQADLTPQPMVILGPDGKPVLDAEGNPKLGFGVYDPQRGMVEVPGGAPPGNQSAKSLEQTNEEIQKLLQPTIGPDGKAKPPAVIERVIDGSLNPDNVFSNNRWSPLGKAIFKAEVLKYDPNWNEQRFTLRRSFTDGRSQPFRNIVALNTAAAHMGLLYDLSVALQNNDLPKVNAAVNTIKSQLTGWSGPLSAEMAASALGAETAAALKGANAAPTDPEIDNWQGKFSSARSPEQIKQGSVTLAKILEGRFLGLQGAWQNAFGPEAYFPLVKPYSLEQFKKVGYPAESINGPAGGKTPKATSSAGEAMQYGVTMPDGSWEPMPDRAAMEATVKETGGRVKAAPKPQEGPTTQAGAIATGPRPPANAKAGDRWQSPTGVVTYNGKEWWPDR